eukprot:TRINITY_DN4162_c0_g1_i2.p1 TRINITY_DN4162_c0_g1~~TRINITY_DN4162_c0_g1_i2.p1  ORF type:complete len:102 (+),score=17.02 TRINITY_DN4162_c0_g1_i2:54-359(+)
MKNNNLTPKQQLQLQRLLAKANNQNEKVPFLKREQNKTIPTLNQLQNPIRALKAEGKWQTLSKEERQANFIQRRKTSRQTKVSTNETKANGKLYPKKSDKL